MEKQSQAVDDIVDIIVQSTGNRGAVHPATAISTCARLSGAFLFESFNFQLEDPKPGTPVLSEEANTEGPKMINLILAVLGSLEVEVDENIMTSGEIQKSEIDFLTALSITLPKAQLVRKVRGLNASEMAQSCAMATAFIIQQCQNDLSLSDGFSTAAFGLIEGSKTIPPKGNKNFKVSVPKKKKVVSVLVVIYKIDLKSISVENQIRSNRNQLRSKTSK